MSSAQTTSQAAPTRLGGYVGAISTVVLLCGGIGALLYYGAKLSNQEHERRGRQRRAAAIEAIKEDPATQTIVHDSELVAMIVDDAAAAERATALVFSDVDFSDKGFKRIAELVNLQDLGVYSCQDTDALFSYIQGMPSIRKIYIETSNFSAESVRLMATLPNLEQVRFEQAMSDDEVELLKATLPNVKLGIPSPQSVEPR